MNTAEIVGLIKSSFQKMSVKTINFWDPTHECLFKTHTCAQDGPHMRSSAGTDQQRNTIVRSWTPVSMDRDRIPHGLRQSLKPNARSLKWHTFDHLRSVRNADTTSNRFHPPICCAMATARNIARLLLTVS